MSQPHSPPASTPSIRLGDVYFILFRRKWLILAFSLLGIVAAAATWFVSKDRYASTAKVMVRYVMENRSVNPVGEGQEIRSPDIRGASVMSSEVGILTSLDLALAVVDIVTPQRILGETEAENPRMAAAAQVVKNLNVDVPRNSGILHVTYENTDLSAVRPVLEQLIRSYLKKHVEVHRSAASYEFLFQKTEELKGRLSDTERELSRLKNQEGIISVADSKREVAERVGELRDRLLEARLQLAQVGAVLGEGAVTNLASLETEPDLRAPSPEDVEFHQSLSTRLKADRLEEIELLSRLTEEHPRVVSLRARIEETERQKNELEALHPGIGSLAESVTPDGSSAAAAFALDETKLRSLVVTTNLLHAQIDQEMQRVRRLESMESDISRLERKRELEEVSYRYFSSTLEQAAFDKDLDSAKITNISVIQNASPPTKATDELKKLLGMVLAGGIFGGIGLAFVLEMFVDTSVKRPSDLRERMKLPVFLNIPALLLNGSSHSKIGANGNGRPRLPHRAGALANGETGKDALVKSGVDAPVVVERAPWDADHQLHPYCEALRDRLVMHFEHNNMTHKPKLIGVTGCREGAGATSISAGLAATLSETGDGNVLLVDLNYEHSAAHPFYRGKPACGLSDILENGHRVHAKVQENLYVAAGNQSNGEQLPIRSKQFTDLLPKLKAGDYDYIIFDMPPVSPTSVSYRLSGFMDVTLLVVEAGKVQKDVVERTAGLLKESRASFATILNKSRTYVPKWLKEEN